MSKHFNIFTMLAIATIAWGCGLEGEQAEDPPLTASADECEPRDHDLGNGIVLRACDDQLIGAEEAEMILEASAAGHTLPEQQQDIAPPLSAVPITAIPVDCRWYQLDTASRSGMVTCPQGRNVVAGGCAGAKRLNVSATWESIANDPPDNGEFWDAVATTNGWLCEQAGLVIIPPRMIVSALCCVPHDSETQGGEL
jgi:hypothetical protein